MHYQKPFYDNEYHTNIKWDEYGEFYHSRGYTHPFVRFATGELIVTQSKFDPGMRRRYKDYNMSIVSTTDDGCPPLYFEQQPKTPAVNPDKPVPKAWLTEGGGQTLLIDHDTCTAISLERDFRQVHVRNDENLMVPVRFRTNALAYIAGPHERPQAMQSAGIKISKPWRYDDPDRNKHRNHIKDLIASCTAWREMSDKPKPNIWSAVMVLANGLIGKSMSDLTDKGRLAVSIGNITYDNQETRCTYLYVKE
jgi:hypothetical protein